MQVPVEPFRRLVQHRIDQHDRQIQGQEAFLPTGVRIIGGGQHVQQETGLNERQLYRLLHEYKTIDFSVADQIVTHTVGPMAWFEDPELREIYENVDLAREDLVNPLDNPVAKAEADERILEAWDKYRSRKDAGAELGLSPAVYSKILDPALERAGRDRSKRLPSTHCHKGHEIAVVGRDKDGSCRTCKREYNQGRRKTERRRIPHGTPAGYKRCRLLHQATCQPCKDAWNEYITGRARAKRAAA